MCLIDRDPFIFSLTILGVHQNVHVYDQPLPASEHIVMGEIDITDRLVTYDLSLAEHGFYISFNMSITPQDNRLPSFGFSRNRVDAKGEFQWCNE